jgi:hypothetical protein
MSLLAFMLWLGMLLVGVGFIWISIAFRDFDSPTPVDFELDDEEDDAEARGGAA